MTADDIKALRALAEAATQGPWQDDADGVHRVHAGRHRVILSINISDEQRVRDAAFVAACSPDRIARLLDALEEAQRDAERVRAVALQAVSHTYEGDCPDSLDRNRRDPKCPACRILGDA